MTMDHFFKFVHYSYKYFYSQVLKSHHINRLETLLLLHTIA